MKYEDEIYGEFVIEDELIIELINSRPFQRLKEISNDGANRYIFEVGDPTRYKHSMGVFYLAQRYSDRRGDHVMALLHDIAHTAFSHVIDFVVGDGVSQDYHDQAISKFLVDSEIAQILRKHDLNPQNFLEKKDYPLVGASSPDLNVDRLDYFLRDSAGAKTIASELIEVILSDIEFDGTSLYFKNQEIATAMFLVALNISRLNYLSANSVGSYYLLSEAIKIAQNEGIVSEEDFFTTDAELLGKMKKASNRQVNNFLDRLTPSTNFVRTDKENAEYTTKNKVRYIDPLVKKDGSFVRITELSKNLFGMITDLKDLYSEVSIKQI
jgi:hypothetical protein